MFSNSRVEQKIDADGCYLVKPRNGDVNVNRNSEIRVLFRGKGANFKRSLVNISINGKVAVSRGICMRGWFIVEEHYDENFAVISIRSSDTLPKSLVFVQASYSNKLASKNMQFYVAESKVIPETPILSSSEIAKGLFYFDRAIFNSKNKIIPRDAVAYNRFDANHNENGDIASVYLLEDKTVIYSSIYGEHVMNFSCIDCKVDSKYINLRISSNISGHWPINYTPSKSEVNIEDMFCFRESGRGWNMLFSREKHIWWNRAEILVRHDVDPIMSYSNDMLWTVDDLGIFKIESVENCHGDFAIINDNILINTRYPEVHRGFRRS